MQKTYTQSAEEVLQDLGVGTEGLTTAQAQERLAKYGPNKLKEAEKSLESLTMEIDTLKTSGKNAEEIQAKLDALKSIFNIGTNLSHIDEIEAQTEFQHMDVVFSLKEKGAIKCHCIIV